MHYVKGQLQRITLVFDIIGFIAIFIGALLIRFSKDEIISVLGALVITIGISIISLTKLLK